MNSLLTALAGLASRLGSFETRLLFEVHAAGDDAYCAELARRLSLVYGREVTMGQVSRTLGALKRIGLMVSDQRYPPTPQKHQRHRLVFSLTESGSATLNALNNQEGTSMSQRPKITSDVMA
jgi:DNA-binding PadR family transcriptional regulator